MPVRAPSQPVERSASFGTYAGEDAVVMLLMPRATWEAAEALGRQLGEMTGGPPLAVPLVIGEALRRLQAEVDRAQR